MGAVRVTQNMMVRRTLNDLNSQTRRLLGLQDQLSTGLKVNSPSDDPLAARRAVNIRTSISKNEQYIDNITSAEPMMTETASSMQTVINVLQRARELTLQGANGSNSQAQRNVIAVEINKLLDSLYSEANHQTQSRFIFGGTRTTTEPFTATRNVDGEITSVTFDGNDEYIKISVGDTTTENINETGQKAFMSDTNMFDVLINIRDNLRAGNLNDLQNARLSDLKVAQDQALASLARVGSSQNQFARMKASLEDYVLQYRSTLSDNIDADYAETVINLNTAGNAFTSALNAASKVLQPSLMDYIR
jgi:flagellar hook-associated protein 3 FlgL